MSLSLSLLYYIKRSKADSLGKTNIYLRITLAGSRSEFSIHRKIGIREWSSRTQLALGNSAECQEINRHLGIIKNKIYVIQQNFERDNELYSALDIRNELLGRNKQHKMLLVLFQEHNDEVEALVGREFSAGTIERYKTCKRHVTDFVKHNYKVNDIEVHKVDFKFITSLEYYLKTIKKNAHNTAVKYIANFKKIIRIALANDWISKDPFLNWKAKLKRVDREYLNQEEIEMISNLEIRIPRLDYVRDIFIFSCFTGLAYIDCKHLTKGNLVLGADGEKWIRTTRKKTETRSNIPILPIAAKIIQKYENDPILRYKGLVLPVLSNQKMNAYIKEIADLCGIQKNLTFHLARHTFATTVTLTNGVPIESVSKMLGHTNLRTTQHYAKVLDMKVGRDMALLKDKLVTN
jgi:site-specific recombinase XerD